MSIIMLDGPEKAGKTTLARAIQAADPAVGYRHWSSSDRDLYAQCVAEDVRRPHPVIWDRGWASAHVYDTLLPDRAPGSTWASDPFLAEWEYGRPTVTAGVRVMVLGPDARALEARRQREPDSGDLPVDPRAERLLFEEYADAWGWSAFTRNGPEQVAAILKKVREKSALAAGHPSPMTPPRWVGPPDARVVFLGEARSPGALTPFGSRYASQYGRILGGDALRCAWTNVDETDHRWLAGRTLIACGQEALTFCYRHSLDATPVPHPSWLYRWGAARGRVAPAEAVVRQVVARTLSGVPSNKESQHNER